MEMLLIGKWHSDFLAYHYDKKLDLRLAESISISY